MGFRAFNGIKKRAAVQSADLLFSLAKPLAYTGGQ